MNFVKYWMRVTITSNPKKMPQTVGQVMNIFIANCIVLLMVSSFTLISNIMIVMFPTIAPIIFLVTLASMLFMFVSLFLRMRKVSEWRYKSEKKAR
ncbi:MAG: hypothetical protein ACYC3G_00250 [Minisyncoccota bacterium]